MAYEKGKAMTPIFAGTFDPLTDGHLDVISSMSKIFGRGIVLLATNPNKEHMLTGADRHELIRKCIAHYNIKNIGVSATYGYVADWAQDLYGKDAVLVRGVRDENDLKYEMEVAIFNHNRTGIKTVFLPADNRFKHVSSTVFKELLKANKWQEIERMLPSPVYHHFMFKMIGK